MGVRIFLDDVRNTPEGFIRTYSVVDTTNLLINHAGEVDELSLDNDLGEGVPEGRVVCIWLAERQYGYGINNLWPKKISIHSANPVARQYMRDTLLHYGPYEEHGGAFYRMDD